ncbi:MAG: hypothetical protein NTV87_15305 [Ignavibacteriae bacterium]|jgi:hypothetical protein|nr:hypothetical protein [Ignavibacteriota bacterium]
MKKTRIFLAVLIVFIGCTSVRAQSLGFYISAHAGPSFPFGDFAKKDANNSNSGFAKTGYKGDITVGYNIPFLFSISFTGVLQNNAVDAEPMRLKIAQENPAYTNWTLDAESWNVTGLFTGVTKNFSFNKKFFFEVRAFGGTLNFDSPRFTLRGTSATDNALIVVNNKTTYAFAYIFAVGCGYNISKNFSLEGNIEYLGANPDFTNVKTQTTINGLMTETTSSYSQSFSAFNITAGLRYSF